MGKKARKKELQRLELELKAIAEHSRKTDHIDYKKAIRGMR